MGCLLSGGEQSRRQPVPGEAALHAAGEGAALCSEIWVMGSHTQLISQNQHRRGKVRLICLIIHYRQSLLFIWFQNLGSTVLPWIGPRSDLLLDQTREFLIQATATSKNFG